MKKLALALATAASFGLASSAQAQGIRLGVKAGANLSNVSGNLNNQDIYKNKFGFVGGVMLNVGLIDKVLSLQPEVLFSQKGFKYADNSFTFLGNTNRFSGNRTYNYIDVPVLLKVRAAGLFFEAGPQYSYLLNVRDNANYSVNGNTVTSSAANQNLDNVRRNEIGYAAGLGYEASNGFLIDVRYNGSFTDFAKDGYNGSNQDLRNARNSVFQASIGYLLGSK
ncbi:porin family protein [Hymenobacter nivis]|uniref:PorT family protein n=1 Tax=Hymenobacter nivis TaxID=1850093 RepID=A0A502GE43_9BACT|nr:porin family protein [Hymenobacter nivis]TPG58973.1 PorT family protein [Hymenobacter nivis]